MKKDPKKPIVSKKVIPDLILPVQMAINPATGEPGLRDAMRYVISELNNDKGIVKGGVYLILPGGLQPRLKQLSIPETYLADFLLVMQYCGLVRRVSKMAPDIKGYKWEICDSLFFNDFINDDSIESALIKTKDRHRTTAKIRQLNEENARLKAKTHSLSLQNNDQVDAGSLDQMNENLAMVIAEVEALRLVNVDLQKKLKAKSGATALETAEALMSRFKDFSNKKTR